METKIEVTETFRVPGTEIIVDSGSTLVLSDTEITESPDFMSVSYSYVGLGRKDSSGYIPLIFVNHDGRDFYPANLSEKLLNSGGWANIVDSVKEAVSMISESKESEQETLEEKATLIKKDIKESAVSDIIENAMGKYGGVQDTMPDGFTFGEYIIEAAMSYLMLESPDLAGSDFMKGLREALNQV